MCGLLSAPPDIRQGIELYSACYSFEELPEPSVEADGDVEKVSEAPRLCHTIVPIICAIKIANTN